MPTLNKITMTGMSEIELAGGKVAWSATLLDDGAPWVKVSNDGNGGCHVYYPASGTDFHKMRDELAEVEKVAVAATGLKYEALDALVSCMSNGDTAAGKVAVVKAEWV